METASNVFESAIAWLQANYATFRFFMERDVVWTVQTYLLRLIEQRHLPYRVFYEYPILPGNRADLVMLTSNNQVEVATEFKYEPDHTRKDILPGGKFPVTDWQGIIKDTDRIKRYAATGKSQAAYSLFIDEGNFYRQRVPPPGSRWITWNPADSSTQAISVLWAHTSTNPLLGGPGRGLGGN